MYTGYQIANFGIFVENEVRDIFLIILHFVLFENKIVKLSPAAPAAGSARAA